MTTTFLKKIFLSKYFGLFFLIVLAIFTLYCSWIPLPIMHKIAIIPNWLADWADAPENMDFRTAVPFALLSTILPLIKKGISTKIYFFHFTLLFMVLLLAELGQLLLPKRHFDWADIYFGLLGIFTGFVVSIGLKKV